MQGAKLLAAVQFPDKLRLEAPVLGEQITVCRNGNEVWATPGKKIEFLISQFRVKPKKKVNYTSPIMLPVTAQQAVFLPALFAVERSEVAEVDNLNGENCRVISAGLLPLLAQATKAEDFRARLWVAPGNLPRQVEVKRSDFTATSAITNLAFSPTLPPQTWQPPAEATDVYRTTPEMLEALLYVVMNSLKCSEEDAPWAKVK